MPGWLAGQLLPLSNQTISVMLGLERGAECGVEKQLKSQLPNLRKKKGRVVQTKHDKTVT